MNGQFSFFQQCMLALLGGQDIRQGMVSFFHALKEFFPLAGLTFDHYAKEEQALVVHYVVTPEGFFDVDHRVPLTASEVEEVVQNELHLHKPQVDKNSANRALSLKHSRLLTPYLPLRGRGYMVNILYANGEVIGHLVCLGQDADCFTTEHIELMSMVLPALGLAINRLVQVQDMNKQTTAMRHEQDRLQRELGVLTYGDLVGTQGGLRAIVDSLRQLAHRDTPVLIIGETGTGKELVANAIQMHSLRAEKPFIKVNCGALSENLLDSELFGHERGAFTGASHTRKGRFELAHGGTLFLDEVGELPLSAQVRLLRVLQDGIFERVGGHHLIAVDVRIIAATNRDLRLMCRQGLFREDLYHRLNVFPLQLPPLRQRREDIPLLTRHLSQRVATRLGMPRPRVLMECMDKLVLYPWPGNVRQLENLIERALIQSPEGLLDLTRFLPQEEDYVPSASPLLPAENAMGFRVEWLEHFLNSKFKQWQQQMMAQGTVQGLASDIPPEADMGQRIRHALRACNGKVYGPGGAAALLGINHNTLRSRMRKLGISAKAEHGIP